MMTRKMFHISDVINVVTGKLYSTRGPKGLVEILEFMTNDDVFHHQIQRALDECKPFVLQQFPVLGTPEMQFALAELSEMLKSSSGKSDPKNLFLGWLSKLTSGKYGIKVDEHLAIERLPEHAHEFIDAHSESAEKIHPDRIIIL